MDAWVYRLKAAYEAGYYQTEPAVRDQSPFPWHNKTCARCMPSIAPPARIPAPTSMRATDLPPDASFGNDRCKGFSGGGNG